MPLREQFVDQTIIEVEAQAVGLAAALRQHARPGHGKPVDLRAKAPHQRHVFAIAMVVVTRHIAGIAIGNTARLSAEQVPDAGAAAVLCGSPLDLIGRGGDAPLERCRQRQGGRHGAPRHSFNIGSSRSHGPLPQYASQHAFCRRLRRSICVTITRTRSPPPHAARAGKIRQTIRLDQRPQLLPTEIP